jgi:hypothetical protein
MRHLKQDLRLASIILPCFWRKAFLVLAQPAAKKNMDFRTLVNGLKPVAIISFAPMGLYGVHVNRYFLHGTFYMVLRPPLRAILTKSD